MQETFEYKKVVNVLDRIYTVEYSIQDEALGKLKLTRNMNQPELGALLLNNAVVLLSVNKQKKTYKPAKRKP